MDTHLLDADVWRVEKHLRDGKALVSQTQDLFPGLILPTEEHLIGGLQEGGDRELRREEVTGGGGMRWRVEAGSSHLAEAFLDGAEVREDVVLHHGVLSAL